MSIVWKIIRIIALYVVSFFVCVIIAAIALDSLPDALEALFALLAPIAFIWWYEKRRATKISEREVLANSPVPLGREDEQLSQPGAYQPRQNNAELIRAGQQARAELEAAAERRTAEKQTRQSQANQFLNQHSKPKKPKEKPLARSQGWVRKG